MNDDMMVMGVTAPALEHGFGERGFVSISGPFATRSLIPNRRVGAIRW
jgi:hypothetical protein